MEKEGTKQIEIADIEDKRQFTAVFAGAMSGEFLPFQLIYQGKTKACLPKVNFQMVGMLHFHPITGQMSP